MFCQEHYDFQMLCHWNKLGTIDLACTFLALQANGLPVWEGT